MSLIDVRTLKREAREGCKEWKWGEGRKAKQGLA